MKITLHVGFKTMLVLIFLTTFFTDSVFAQKGKQFTSADKAGILKTLADQQAAWNEGNIEKFMDGYWKSDSMQFIGKRGINYGWKATLESYKKGYPDTVAMGKLTFDILKINPVSADAAFLTGKFYLKRSIGDASGIFTLVLRKFDGKWLVVYDHTSD
jgi:ketosteroid isomerase-like protein